MGKVLIEKSEYEAVSASYRYVSTPEEFSLGRVEVLGSQPPYPRGVEEGWLEPTNATVHMTVGGVRMSPNLGEIKGWEDANETKLFVLKDRQYVLNEGVKLRKVKGRLPIISKG